MRASPLLKKLLNPILKSPLFGFLKLDNLAIIFLKKYIFSKLAHHIFNNLHLPTIY